jgi:hypothetical protein
MQGFQGSTSRVEANVEYVAGKFGSEMLNRGYDPHVRCVIEFWGKQRQLRATVVKGILSSGIKIVSFTEATPDAEIVQPTQQQKHTAVNPMNSGMWARFYKQQAREREGKGDEPEE